MNARWISGIILALVLVALILFLPAGAIKVLIIVLSGVGLWEYSAFMLNAPPLLLRVALVMFGVGITLLLMGFLNPAWLMPWLVFSLMGSFLLHFKGNPDFKERISHLALFVFGFLYIGLLFSYLGLVRSLPHWDFWFFLMLAATFMADTGAYIFGRWIGKRKLAPQLSPGKTLEGFMGGWLFAVIAGLVVRALFWVDFSLLPLFVISSLIALVGPLGDLSESLLKRGAGKKDSGSLIPGHGGLLDRVDALLFTAPVVYYFAQWFL